jgi:hypothetical protein
VPGDGIVMTLGAVNNHSPSRRWSGGYGSGPVSGILSLHGDTGRTKRLRNPDATDLRAFKLDFQDHSHCSSKRW